MRYSTVARALAVSAVLAVLITLMGGPVSAAPNLETFVMATNGRTTSGVFRAPDPTFDNIGTLSPYVPFEAISTPTTLAGIGVAGTWRVTDSTVAPALSDALSTSGAGGSDFGGWTYNGNTAVTVQYGQIKSESHAVHVGGSDNRTINRAESYGIMRETFTVLSSGVANGTNGTMRIALSINGNMSVVGTGRVGMVFRYGFGANPALNNTLLETFDSIYGNGYQQYGPHSSFGSFITPPGFTTTIGPTLPPGAPSFMTFGGASTVYATVPIVYGASTDYLMGLYTFTDIGNGNGTMDTDFAHSATITGIEMFDNGGNKLSAFSITSGSGTFYDANGVRLAQSAAAPEPSALALLAPVLPLAGRMIRKRHSRQRKA